MAKKELRCGRVKRSDAQVDWDDPANPIGNRQHVRDHGLTEDEVESVLLDDDAVVVPNRSPPTVASCPAIPTRVASSTLPG